MLSRPPYRRALVYVATLLPAIVLAGGAIEVGRLGWTDQEASSRVAAGVKAEFDRNARAIDTIARAAAEDTSLIQGAPLDAAASRGLFAALARVAEPDVSVTVYSAQRQPIAWAGRPSDNRVLARRLDGPASFFVLPDPAGARLVRTWPASVGRGSGGGRLATIVVERPLPTATSSGDLADSFIWPTPVARVFIRARDGGAGASPSPPGFTLQSPDGTPLLDCTIPPADVATTRARYRGLTAAATLSFVGLLLAWIALPLTRELSRRASVPAGTARTAIALGAIGAARVCARLAAGLADVQPSLGLGTAWPAGFRSYVSSPIDLFMTGLSGLAAAAVLSEGCSALRLALRDRRANLSRPGAPYVRFALLQLIAAAAAVAGVAWYDRALVALAAIPGLDLVSFSLPPWDVDRILVSSALVALHGTVLWVAVSVLRAGTCAFAVGDTIRARALWVLAWILPIAFWSGVLSSGAPGASRAWALMLPVAVAMALAWGALRFAHWRRHASQSATIVSMFLALSLPSVAFYPLAYGHAASSRRAVVEHELAPQVLRQREDLKVHVDRTREQVDRIQGLAALAAGTLQRSAGAPPTDAAFLVWSQTDLGTYRLTSAVELYGADGSLVSRFALNLPEYASGQQTWVEPGCKWDQFEEVSPFGSEERRLLHAGRGLCVPGLNAGRPIGAIVLHAQLDYAALPFLSSQSPYVEFFRRARIPGVDTPRGRDTEFAVYGWSRRPLFESFASVWTLDDKTFGQAYRSRVPFWTRQDGAGRSWDVFLANDRSGIFALGIPTTGPLGHLVQLAELGVLTGALYAVWLLLSSLVSALGLSAPGRGRELFNEIRVSFYRKLAIGVVVAAVVPVLILAALTQTYMSAQLRAGIDDAAVRTAAVAQRVVEDYGRLQERADNPNQPLTDDILVWISRVIDEDVSVYDGPRLEATSERDLFASGLLPTRTPATVYRAIGLERRATFVDEERAGAFPYLVAAAPARVAGREVIITVPLTLRQQAIEREVDALKRRILLAVVAFVLIGWGFGWWMAERIADPVRRLQRATERMARGDLDIRLARTSSNELSRLLSAFGHMAHELRRHQEAAARANKLEAWADMARQVAHEIKNPLTPIQLSAEHLRRVHADRGAPLGAVFENCIDTILAQVRLLRQIAGDFSSFASSPTPRPVRVIPLELVDEVMAPYLTGLPGSVSVSVDAPADLPPIEVDRSLLGRALANVVENALHAMPSGGTLAALARRSADGRAIEFVVRDSGIGMEPAALERIFEPYFSTKAIGTGLGLTIVKRNVELHGGTVRVDSRVGAGTTVTIAIPLPSPSPGVVTNP